MLELLPSGAPRPAGPRWSQLADAFRTFGTELVIDAGTGVPPEPLVELATHTYLVIRPCYLAVRRAVRDAVVPTGVILVGEPGRALSARDVERTLGAPVVAEVPFDPAIARAVDSGLLAARLPRTLTQPLRSAA